jgi:hypothetical protein
MDAREQLTVQFDDVVRDVVAELAPEELPVVDGVLALRNRDSWSGRPRWGSRSEPLGFGWDGIGTLVTAIVFVALESLSEGATDSLVQRLKGWVKRRFGKARKQPVELTFTPEQLAAVYDTVREVARKYGEIDDEKSERIADALHRRLTLGIRPPYDPDPTQGAAADGEER